MAGLQVIAKDKKGNIKQDYEISRTEKTGKVVKTDALKQQQKEQQKNGRKTN